MRLFVVFILTSWSSIFTSAMPNVDMMNAYKNINIIRSTRSAKLGLKTTTNEGKDVVNHPARPLSVHVHATSTTYRIEVGRLVDASEDPNQCSTSSTCTLRSAWAKCLSIVSASVCTNPISCTVVLPTNQTLNFIGTLGALSVTTTAFNAWSAACPTTPVTLSIVSGAPGALAARIVGDASAASFVSVQNKPLVTLTMTNVNIAGFGDFSTGFSGALYVNNLGGLLLDHVAVWGAKGQFGGAVSINYMRGVTLTGCSFVDNHLVSTDYPYPAGAAVFFETCQVWL